ncbi:MAG TPA: hypothetical protein VGL99_18420 [Chloroflexota bacterium]
MWLASALISSACGILPGGQAGPTPGPPTTAPAAPPAPSPAAAKPSAAAVASPSAVAKPTATTSATALERVWVGNTDGEGVYLRKTPVMADRIKAYPDRTPLTIVDVDVDGDGQQWHHVKAPDGVEGYVPVQYTVTTEP